MSAIHRTVALVPAAGTGERVGLGCSKGLLDLGGKSSAQWTLEAIEASGCIAHAVLITRECDTCLFSRLPLNWSFVTMVTGGATRQESVRLGLEFVRAKFGQPETLQVLVHDVARCLVRPDLIKRCVEQGREWGAVTAAVPLTDSIKRVRSDLTVEASLSREGVYAVQTPQVFWFDLLHRAHSGARGYATDDASLVESLHPVRVVPGERENIKITTREDLALAELIMRTRP